MNIDDNILNFLKKIDLITVSIDGLEESHNDQRKSYLKINPFVKTLENIKKFSIIKSVKK